MGRNPVVGRQGPEYHAADIPSESEAGVLAVKQIRSAIGHPETMRRTLARARASGTISRPCGCRTRPSIRGMLYKVRHLVEVTPGEGRAVGHHCSVPSTGVRMADKLAFQPTPAPRLDSGPQARGSRTGLRPGQDLGQGTQGTQGAHRRRDQSRASRAARCRCTAACRSAGSPIRSR